MSLPFLLAILALSPVYAMDVLDPIEVEATKDVERFTFSDSTTIDRSQIERKTSVITTDLLTIESSLIPSQSGGPGSQVYYFLRGTDSSHIAFTIDGLKMNDTSAPGRSFDAAYFTSPFLNEVQIHKGPQPVLFGSDAIGGVVEFKARKGGEKPETRLTINGGSFGTVDATLSSDWNSKKHKGTLTFTQFHTDGLSRLNKKRHDAKEEDATDITQVTSGSTHQWTNKIQTELLLSYLHASAEYDGTKNAPPYTAVDRKGDYTKTNQYIAQQKTNVELSKTQSISLRNGLNRMTRLDENSDSGKSNFDSNFIQHELIHRGEWNNFGLLSGVSTEHEEAKTAYMKEESLDQTSVFSQAALKLNQWNFHLGGRLEEHSKYGTFTTGSGGVSFGFGKNKVFTQYSQGFKAPSLYQLFDTYSGNANLDPETNDSVLLGWERKTDTLETGITFFKNSFSNMLTYNSTSGKYFNQNHFISEGLEVTGKYKLNKFHFFGNYTYQEFKKNETPVLRRPHNIAVLGMSYFPVESLEFNLKGSIFSSREDKVGANFVKLAGYEVIDFGVKKTWEKDAVGIEIKNILDREYENIYGYSTMPRSVFGHYSHTF